MLITRVLHVMSCYCYHKGTYFQANHNHSVLMIFVLRVVIATTKVRIFKQITTKRLRSKIDYSCYCYHKGTYFQANHNIMVNIILGFVVVIATTKVRIFKQITTLPICKPSRARLLLLPQRYVFSSKSQLVTLLYKWRVSCYCYHKGTYFQANHNIYVVTLYLYPLLLLPQRYVFSSKSQRQLVRNAVMPCCYCYHKGTYFQANHNRKRSKVS